MLTPGEFDEQISQEEWAEQLLLMFNTDRQMHGLPELEAETWDEEDAEGDKGEMEATAPAGGDALGAAVDHLAEEDSSVLGAEPSVVKRQLTVSGDPSKKRPSLDMMWGSSAWLLFTDAEPPSSGGGGGGGRASPAASPAPPPSQPPAPATTAAVDLNSPDYVPEDVQAFMDALDDASRERLQKLYRIGVIQPRDPVFRQKRYVDAVGKAGAKAK